MFDTNLTFYLFDNFITPLSFILIKKSYLPILYKHNP